MGKNSNDYWCVTRKNVTVFNAQQNRIVEGEINLEENVIRDIPIPDDLVSEWEGNCCEFDE